MIKPVINYASVSPFLYVQLKKNGVSINKGDLDFNKK